IVKDNDIISINIPQRKIELELAQSEIERRLKLWRAPKSKVSFGYLARYKRQVTAASKGAILS
ncbi:MAG: dihydroxy-acid dehydratase, partial [Candidatus Omnitrophica bacterium]|nr:dihydroxy-acid dehydratase [Candidatus Omnitrophota bacterium]